MSEDAQAPDCSFCGLLSGEGELSIVMSNELVVAFMDASPVAAGHVLVAPRRHVSTLGDLTGEEGAALWTMTQLMADRVKAVCAPAINLHLSDGVEAEQEVPHVHLHVLPRHGDDAVTISLPGDRASRQQLDRVAASLAADQTSASA